ncbi:MAG TPA: hypothetical protein VNW04_23870, partial [Puia sp.]|nr:hypothetical protein [Puia sp.]
MWYAFEASLTLAILYSTYYLFLRNTRFHQLNRFVLIGIAVASLTVPRIANYLTDLAGTPHFFADGHVLVTPPVYPISIPSYFYQWPNAPLTQSINWTTLIIAGLYAIGLTIFLLRAVAPILALQKLIRASPKNRA